MKQNLSLWQYGAFAFVSIFGTLLHFLYDWTNKSVVVAPFAATNESTWEHMKLLFFPMFVFAIIQSFFFSECVHFWCAKLVGILSGLVLIPVLFYTYNGAVGKSPDWLNIAIFFVSAAVAVFVEAMALKNALPNCRPALALFIIILIAGVFVIFSFYPPTLAIFVDPTK